MKPNIIYKVYQEIGNDIHKLKHLFEHAFPKEERPSFNIFIEMKNHLFYAIYDDTTFIGLIDLVVHNDICFIFFLAFKKKYRHQGYGSLVLKDFLNKYQDYRIYLLMEEVDEKYPNYIERKNRLSFYLKNGLTLTNRKIDEFNIIYSILTNNKDINYDDHMRVMDYILSDEYKDIYHQNCKEY